MNPADLNLIQALISSRPYSYVPPQTGIDPRSQMPIDPNQYPNAGTPRLNYLNDIDKLGTYTPGQRESTHVETATPWKDIPVLQKFILKFLSQSPPNQTYSQDPMLPQPQDKLQGRMP